MSIKKFNATTARGWVVAFVLIFVFQSETFSQVIDGNAADLWRRFYRLSEVGDDQGAYFAMKELCRMDSKVSLEDKFSRWRYCAKHRLDDILCVSKSAVSDETRFILGMNCRIVMKEGSSNVRFGRSNKGGSVDYVGIAYKFNN